MAKSGSSAIKEFLLSSGATYETTTPELALKLGVSLGTVSGMLHRIKKHGAAEIIGVRNGHSVYRIEATLMDDVRVKNVASAGGVKGKKGCGGHKTAHLPDLTEVNKAGSYDVISALLEAAGWLEAHKPTLDDFTTNDLIDELKRRTQK